MKELYSIMRDFLEVEYNQESLLCLLKAAEAADNSDERAETDMVINEIANPPAMLGRIE